MLQAYAGTIWPAFVAGLLCFVVSVGVTAATRLDTILIWNGQIYDFSFAKLRSCDELFNTKRGMCRAGHIGNLHGCDSTEKSSSFPIFAYGEQTVVAVHIVGNWKNVSNCALPIAGIFGELESTAADPVACAVLQPA
jgi:hypothetical protein